MRETIKSVKLHVTVGKRSELLYFMPSALFRRHFISSPINVRVWDQGHKRPLTFWLGLATSLYKMTMHCFVNHIQASYWLLCFYRWASDSYRLIYRRKQVVFLSSHGHRLSCLRWIICRMHCSQIVTQRNCLQPCWTSFPLRRPQTFLLTNLLMVSVLIFHLYEIPGLPMKYKLNRTIAATVS